MFMCISVYVTLLTSNEQNDFHEIYYKHFIIRDWSIYINTLLNSLPSTIEMWQLSQILGWEQ